jgi:hypothetical protein
VATGDLDYAELAMAVVDWRASEVGGYQEEEEEERLRAAMARTGRVLALEELSYSKRGWIVDNIETLESTVVKCGPKKSVPQQRCSLGNTTYSPHYPRSL